MHTVSKSDHTPINPFRFRWMPAALEYPNMGGLGCYIRYKRYVDKPVGLRLREANRIILECPDRDLFFTRDAHHQWGYRPAEGVWDEYASFSLFNAQTKVDQDIQFWMLNYTDYITSNEDSPKLRLRERQPYEGYVVADSGGFQLAYGRYEWIDPRRVIEWYNENVDLGMALDIPTYGVENEDDFLTLAKAHRHNLEMMLKLKRPSLEMINIFHGHSRERMNMYRKVVEHPDVDRLALGGTYMGTILGTLDSNFGLMVELKDRYKHFHILGVWNLLQLIALMRFSSHDVVKLITSDSSTPLQNANAKRYAYQPVIDEKWQMRDLGFIGTTTQVNHNLTLPCSCPVCSAVKYTDVFSVLGGALLTHILAHHNIFQMNNYVKVMQPLVAELSIKELTELMTAQLGSRRGIQEAKLGLMLADEIAEVGHAAARKKFAGYLGGLRDVEYAEDNSLFSDDAVPVNEEEANATPDMFKRKVDLAHKFLDITLDNSKLHGKKTDLSVNKAVLKATTTTRKSGIESEKKKQKKPEKTRKSPSVRSKNGKLHPPAKAGSNPSGIASSNPVGNTSAG